VIKALLPATLAILGLAAVAVLLPALVLLAAWNIIAPLFGLPIINYLQAIAIVGVLFVVGNFFRS